MSLLLLAHTPPLTHQLRRYIVYDVQMLMGGEHQHKVSPDEYVFAAVAIYLDIINL